MQQHLMQQNPLMAYATHPSNVTTDLIQQYLDENKQLILAILDNQNAGKVDECAANQAKLQRNLMYLAAIADSQPQVPTISQFPPNAVVQSGTRYVQPQQSQQMTPESLMAARSPMLYAQQSLSALQQQQHQQALHCQPGLSSGGNNGLHMLYGETGMASRVLPAGGFPDFGLNRTANKQETGGSGSAEGRGTNPGGQSGDGVEPLYLKASEEGGN